MEEKTALADTLDWAEVREGDVLTVKESGSSRPAYQWRVTKLSASVADGNNDWRYVYGCKLTKAGNPSKQGGVMRWLRNDEVTALTRTVTTTTYFR